MNVLLVTAHDLGRRLGCYGVGSVATPNIDALSESGSIFTNAFSAAPGCSPSRAALATGRHPHANGVMGLAHEPFGWDLATGEQHIAEILGRAGYRTHLFGHQHIALRVERLGFTDLHGIHHRDCDPAEAIADEACAVLASVEGPWYAEVNFDEPHRPFAPGCEPEATREGVIVPPYLPDTEQARADLAAMDRAIEVLDRAVGRIINAIDDETLVIFTTDHGIPMPRAKCTLYDAGIETALVVRRPGAQRGAHDQIVSNVDVVPSILDALELPRLANLHGQSIWGEPRSAIFAGKTFHSYYDPMRAVRTDRWKFIRNFETNFALEIPGDVAEAPTFLASINEFYGLDGRPDVELYDLQADPAELRNLGVDPQRADIARELDAQLRDWMATTGDPLVGGPVASPSYRRSSAS